MSYRLIQTSEGMALTADQKNERPFYLDFTQGAILYRQQHLQGRNELIAKAIGWKKGLNLSVFDLTAGLGKEAFLLASLGCQLVLFERHPVVATLLKDALNRAKTHPDLSAVIDRMTLIEQCALHYLKTTPLPILPDVIYCDPMFPLRTKTAAVKKEMQLLQTLVGTDQDAQALVEQALSKAKKRVVVKRALTAPPLQGKPDLSYAARSHRFDVYLIHP